MKGEYGLNIAFNMKTYAQLNLEEGNSCEFEINEHTFKLTNLKKSDAYSMIIKPIDNKEHAESILNKFKIALIMFVLEYNFATIEIDDEIKDANILDEPRYVEEDWLVSGDFDLDRTMLFPLIPNLVQFTSSQLSFTNLLNIENLVGNIEKTDELNIDCIINDEKLILALEIYSKLSQYHFKAQFLDLITILEILKPKYPISNNSLKHLDMIKKYIKKLRDDNSEKNSEEYDELNRYLSSMNFWDEKSINKSLKIYVNENRATFGDYENIETKLKDAYDIRSKLIHNGKISDEKEFYEKYQFLKDFVKELLLNRINDYKN